MSDPSPEQVIAAALQPWTVLTHAPAAEIVAALRAAGLLPGPDDIVVSREALETALVEDAATTPLGAYNATMRRLTARDTLLAVLSQPHPAQEQQT